MNIIQGIGINEWDEFSGAVAIAPIDFYALKIGFFGIVQRRKSIKVSTRNNGFEMFFY